MAEDFEYLNRLMPAALTRRAGNWIWRAGDDTRAVFSALDGTDIQATGFSSIDVVGLATATGAHSVQFDLGMGVSSSRRQGGALSTEIILDITGLDASGPLTALGITLLLERLIGLDGKPPVAPGLYFPYQILDASRYLSQLAEEGGEVRTLTSV